MRHSHTHVCGFCLRIFRFGERAPPKKRSVGDPRAHAATHTLISRISPPHCSLSRFHYHEPSESRAVSSCLVNEFHTPPLLFTIWLALRRPPASFTPPSNAIKAHALNYFPNNLLYVLPVQRRQACTLPTVFARQQAPAFTFMGCVVVARACAALVYADMRRHRPTAQLLPSSPSLFSSCRRARSPRSHCQRPFSPPSPRLPAVHMPTLPELCGARWTPSCPPCACHQPEPRSG